MSYLKTSTFKSIFELCDVVSIAFYCSADATMMLIIEPNTNEYWIPSVKVTAPNSWVTYMTKDLIQDVKTHKYQNQKYDYHFADLRNDFPDR